VEESKFGYEDLDVWHKSLDWASKIITLIENLGTERKHYRLIEQLESAACSVSQNIAEGKGRFHSKEFIQFLYFARGSLYETITLLELFRKQNWVSNEDFEELKIEGKIIAKKLNALISSIKNQQP